MFIGLIFKFDLMQSPNKLFFGPIQSLCKIVFGIVLLQYITEPYSEDPNILLLMDEEFAGCDCTDGDCSSSSSCTCIRYSYGEYNNSL